MLKILWVCYLIRIIFFNFDPGIPRSHGIPPFFWAAQAAAGLQKFSSAAALSLVTENACRCFLRISIDLDCGRHLPTKN